MIVMRRIWVAGWLLATAVGLSDGATVWNAGAGNWNVAGNWNPPQVPDDTVDAVIDTDVEVTVPNGYDANVRNLTLSHGNNRGLYISNTGSLTVHGDYEQTAGLMQVRVITALMTVKGDFLATAGMGRLIQGGIDGLVVEGNLTATSGYTFSFNMNNSSTGIKRVVVGGKMTLGGAKLSLANFIHNDMEKILLFHNTSDQEVTGSFDIPWGTTFDLGAEEPYALRLVDWDGDGVANDVVLEKMEPVEPGVITWVHPGSGDWHVPANWDLDRVPIAGDEVQLNPGAGVTVSIYQNASAGSVHIESGDLVLQTVGNLDVSGNLEQTGGLVNTRTGLGKVIVGGNFVATAGMGRIIQGDKDAFVIEGDLTATDEYTFDFNMNSSANGIGRIVVGGTVDLGGAIIDLRNFVHNDMDEILIFHNTSDQEVIGAFHIPWGTPFDLGAEELYGLRLIDWDGDGIANDVALVKGAADVPFDIEAEIEGGQMVLSWPHEEGELWTVWSTTDLINQPFEPIAVDVAQGIYTTQMEDEVRFFRVSRQ